MEERWTGLDGAFNYDEFADVLFGLFEVDPKWTQVTLAWWNQWVVVNSGDMKLTKFIYCTARCSVIGMAEHPGPRDSLVIMY